jgi:threonylcarbamoyladenosine tRNA methylthiotransferase MtaB
LILSFSWHFINKASYLLSGILLRKVAAVMTRSKKDKNRVAIATLGCKVNQCESASFNESFTEKGYEVTPFSQTADIYVINTCAVTAKAAAQSRQMIRKAQRTNPNARLLVTGCYAQVDPQKIKEIVTGPVCIVGNANKHQLFDAAQVDTGSCRKCSGEGKPDYFDEISAQKLFSHLPYKDFAGRTRAFLKIQDGCNNFCSYCIVPYARGRSRSLAPAEVMHQAALFVDEGYKEIVLTGIHVGHYGLDLEPAANLLDLLYELTEQSPQTRFRLSSLEPGEVSPELLQFMAGTDNFMPHLHIPLQSGDDMILQKMKRRYTVADFTKIIGDCKTLLPHAAIGVDVLVGFPGEDDVAFNNTIELLKNLPVTYLHVFPYSRRPGTPAAGFADQVPEKIKKQRVAVLRELDHKKRTAFYRSHLGEVHRVLVETVKSKDGLANGFTENYIPVQFHAEPADANQVVLVKLEQAADKKVLGTTVDQ